MKYKAIFIIPPGASRVLTDAGWEFESKNRISSDIVDALVRELGLEFQGEDAGMVRYSTSDVKLVVFLDDERKVEHLYFQCFLSENRVASAFEKVKTNAAELLIPR